MKDPVPQLGFAAVALTAAVCKVDSRSGMLYQCQSKGKGGNKRFGIGTSIEIATQGIFDHLARMGEQVKFDMPVVSCLRFSGPELWSLASVGQSTKLRGGHPVLDPQLGGGSKMWI